MDVRRTERFALVLGFLSAFLIFFLRAASKGLLELGDGINHYSIARYSWAHPNLLLDLWGKPLFTLLSSPFAQLGHIGMAAFNTIVMALTVWVGVRALRIVGGAAQVMFVLLLGSPQYVEMVAAGMTEPLFGLVTILTVMLLRNGRYRAGAAVCSLAPFARPEYVAFVPIVLLWLVHQRQWRAVPWCSLGIAVYMVLSAWVFGDPLHFWAGDPYVKASGVYGSGPLDHFIRNADQAFGLPLLFLGMLSLVLWPWIYWRLVDDRSDMRAVLWLSAIPVLGIVAVHSMLWWTGWRGSAGLIRVLATTVPLLAFFSSTTLVTGAKRMIPDSRTLPYISGVLLLCLGYWTTTDLHGRVDLPMSERPDQQILVEVAEAMEVHLLPEKKVFSTHPYMAFLAGLDPYDPTQYNQLWELTDQILSTQFNQGDLLVWDSQLGSNESNVPLERLLDEDKLAVLGVFEPSNGSRVLGGHVYEFLLLERRDVIRTWTVDTLFLVENKQNWCAMRVDSIPCNEKDNRSWCLNGDEFPLEFRGLELPGDSILFDEWMVSGSIDLHENSPLSIVLSQTLGGKGLRYDQQDLKSGEFAFSRKVPPSRMPVEQVIYFWNIGKAPFTLNDLMVVRKRWTQRAAGSPG